MRGPGRNPLASALAITVVLGFGIPAERSAAKGAAQEQSSAKITMQQARATALDAAKGGKVVDQEYEKENGAWRYSFDIRQGARIHEIGVDAQSGKIVENSWEGLKDKD